MTHQPGQPLGTIHHDLRALIDGDALMERAYDLMREGHEGQRRVGGEPFWAHPARVALALADAGHDAPDLIAAALTHDLVEDTPMDVDDIAAALDAHVAELVEALTVPDDPAARTDYYAELPDAPHPAQLVKVADRTDNLLCLAQLVDKEPRRLGWGRAYLRRSAQLIEPLTAQVPDALARRYSRARDCLAAAVA